MKHAHNFVDLSGQVFFRLTVIKYLHTRNKRAFWLCKCSCGSGRDVIVTTQCLREGKSKSCGCWKQESFRKRSTTHGFKSSPDIFKNNFYDLWGGMKARCLNTNHKSYPDYGGRGIKVCTRWMKFENFCDDMWEAYLQRRQTGETISLERMEVDSNYEPSNCKWATDKEQGKNTRASVKSENHDEHVYWKNYLGSSLSRLISHHCKRSKVLEPYLGCSFLAFTQHIEFQFTDGMTWDNYGRGFGKWEIDHILGCNNFDLSKEEDRKKCFNFTNLRPFWSSANRQKSRILVSR
jgi:hypothetical protein